MVASVQERLEQMPTAKIHQREREALFESIRSTEKQLFNEALGDRTWVESHQGLVVLAIRKIYPDQAGISKIRDLSQVIVTNLKRTQEGVESLSNAQTIEIVDAIQKHEFLRLRILLEKNENHLAELDLGEIKKAMNCLETDELTQLYIILQQFPFEF